MKFCLYFSSICALILSPVEGSDDTFENKLDALSYAKKTDQRWQEFQNELAWFIGSLSPTKEINQNDNDLDNYFEEKWRKENEQLIKAITEAQTEFVQFCDKLSDVLFLKDKGHYAAAVRASALLDITNWYTQYLEQKLFPYDWKSSYKAHSKSKNESVLSNKFLETPTTDE